MVDFKKNIEENSRISFIGNIVNTKISNKTSKIQLFSKINNEASASNDAQKTSFTDSTFLSKDTISALKKGVKYITSKIPKQLAPAYSVYTSNGKYKISDSRVSDFTETGKNGSTGWNFDSIVEKAGNLSSAQKANLSSNLKDYANFMTNEDYKKNASSQDVAPIEEKQNIQNCLDICDYMNFGYSIDPKSQIFAENTNWSEVEYVNNSETGFYGEVFANNETKELIIGYCGTNDAQDVATDDLNMMLKEVPDQYNDAMNLYLKYANDPQYNDYKISLTGHSLGASLAQLVGATDGVMNSDNPPIIATFNAFGTHEIIENNKENYNFVEQESLNNSSIYNYITEGDLVSCTTKHVGQTTWVKNQSPVAHMTTSLHLGLSPEKYDVNKGRVSMFQEAISAISNLFKKKTV